MSEALRQLGQSAAWISHHVILRPEVWKVRRILAAIDTAVHEITETTQHSHSRAMLERSRDKLFDLDCKYLLMHVIRRK